MVLLDMPTGVQGYYEEHSDEALHEGEEAMEPGFTAPLQVLQVLQPPFDAELPGAINVDPELLEEPALLAPDVLYAGFGSLSAIPSQGPA